MFVLYENARPKKRPRDCLETISGDSCEQTERGRKRKRSALGDSHTGHWPPGFWNRLSKVHLTRGALREFERRTAQDGSGAPQSPPVPISFLVTSSESGPRRLQRFSRHGGPDLTHIRGVSTPEFMTLLLQSGSANIIAVCSHPRSRGQHEPVELQPEAVVRIRSVRIGAKQLDTHEQRVI